MLQVLWIQENLETEIYIYIYIHLQTTDMLIKCLFIWSIPKTREKNRNIYPENRNKFTSNSKHQYDRITYKRVFLKHNYWFIWQAWLRPRWFLAPLSLSMPYEVQSPQSSCRYPVTPAKGMPQDGQSHCEISHLEVFSCSFEWIVAELGY